MVLMSGMELPVKAIREQVSSALDIVVQQSRMRDGSRKITNITEVLGMEGEVISLQDIFVFDREGKGKYRATGVRPRCIEKLKNNGAMINDDWFED